MSTAMQPNVLTVNCLGEIKQPIADSPKITIEKFKTLQPIIQRSTSIKIPSTHKTKNHWITCYYSPESS